MYKHYSAVQGKKLPARKSKAQFIFTPQEINLEPDVKMKSGLQQQSQISSTISHNTTSKQTQQMHQAFTPVKYQFQFSKDGYGRF